MENIILNEQQERAKAAVVKWYNEEKDNKLCFVLSGYAGTGKNIRRKSSCQRNASLCSQAIGNR